MSKNNSKKNALNSLFASAEQPDISTVNNTYHINTERRDFTKAPIKTVGFPNQRLALLDIAEQPNVVSDRNETYKSYGWVVLVLFLNGKYENTIEEVFVTSIKKDVLQMSSVLKQNKQEGRLTIITLENGEIRANCGSYEDYRNYNHIITAELVKLA